MAGSASDLFDAAADWLAVCAEAVASTSGGAIARAFVAPGPPAFDCCPQLTVHVGAVAEGDTAPLSPPLQPGHRTQMGAVGVVALTAEVIRCVPTISETAASVVLPDPGELEAAAAMIDEDIWAIWAFTRTRFADGSLFPSPSGSREMFFDAAFSVPTEGGCGGWQIPIRVALGGYRPT